MPTMIGWAKQEVSKFLNDAGKWIRSKEGAIAIGSAISGLGIGSIISTKDGREGAAKVISSLKTTLSNLKETAGIKSTKEVIAKMSSALAAKVTNLAGCVGVAVVAGYSTGLVFGDYFKGDAKNFFKQFGQDLALNLTTGPIGSIVKHYVENKDMVKEDVVNNIIKPVASTVAKIGQKIGIIPSANAKSGESNSSTNTGIVTPEESGRQVVEYERSKAKPTTTVKTTSDRLAEYMKKNKGKGNHPDWYAKYPEFVTTNLNFGVRKEAQYFKVALGALISAAQMIPQREKSTSQAYIDQLNVLFAKLRGSNSGAFNYTVEDLMNYIECVRAIRIIMHQISKYIKSINNIDLYIAKTPDATMQVLGMDAAAIADLRQNRALYIARFNEYAEAIDSNFPTPPDMTVFDRDEYLSTVILEEGKGPKSSIYSYKFTQLIRAYTNPGEIEYQGFATTYGVNDYFTALDTFINRAHAYVSATYSNYDTFAKIAGDIFKAYGNLGLKRRFNKLSLSDKNVVMYDEYLLHQLQNAQTLTLLGNTYLGVTGATPTTIGYTAQIRVQGNNSSNYIPKERVIGNIRGTEAPLVINTNKSDISGAEAISLTRGNWYFDLNVNMLYGNTGQVVEVDTCDTVALIQCTAFYFDANNTVNSTLFRSFAHDIGFPQHYSVWSQLDYAPAFYLYDESNNNGDRYLIEDIDTYAYMTVDQYRAFTDTAVISMYKTVDISDQVNFRAVKR